MIKRLKILFLILGIQTDVQASFVINEIKKFFSIVNIVELTAFKKLLL